MTKGDKLLPPPKLFAKKVLLDIEYHPGLTCTKQKSFRLVQIESICRQQNKYG